MKYAAALLVLALLMALALQRSARRPATESAPDRPPAAEAEVHAPAEKDSLRPEDRFLVRLNAPDLTIEEDLRLVASVFRAYRLFVKDPAGNPVGTHREIIRALQGRNRARLALLPASHPALNADGELCDRWGTPFFFHALSSERMEIRSAGPDRVLWTEDDAVYDPAAGSGRKLPLRREIARPINQSAPSPANARAEGPTPDARTAAAPDATAPR